jgi:4-amino-4-deoxy-L-arabinose transferase-like glycosyltransferase
MEAAHSPLNRARVAAFAGLVILTCFRLAHIHLLWADEDYHLATALQMLHGKIPYRDFWYDKPPLTGLYYLLIAGYSGWPLRILDAVYVLIACYLAFRLARAWWSEAEGWTAALLLAFFLTFYLPSAVISFAADALMIVPHFAAIYCARRRLILRAGLWAGIAFLTNAKAVFVLAVCIIWLWPKWELLVAGFVIPAVAGLVAALASGAWSGYVEQVWRWGFLYAEGSPVRNPAELGIVRTAHWLGFHAALLAAAVFAFRHVTRDDRRKLGSWLILSFAAVCLGARFAPHYFLQLLPPMVITASRGVALALRNHRKVALPVLVLTLLVPMIRFGPRYASLGYDNFVGRPPRWSDVVLDVDSRDAARRIRSLARPGDTLFVWGYRPDVYVYARMVPDGVFSDSQPLTGVPADRHLSATNAIYGGPAARNREKLIRSHPTFMVDGLGLLNPRLKPAAYPELRPWLAHYELIERTRLSLIYRKIK